jgi:hypothetical protein
VKKEGDKNLEANLHSIPENANVKSNNTVLVKLFNEECKDHDKQLILSLIP